MKFRSTRLLKLSLAVAILVCMPYTVPGGVAESEQVAGKPAVSDNIMRTKISLGDYWANHHYFSISPENLSGTKVAYSLCPTENLNRTKLTKGPGQLWICNTDGSDQQKIADIGSMDEHRGAQAIWLDDNRIAYHDRKGFLCNITDLNGNIVSYLGDVNDYCPSNNLIIFKVSNPKNMQGEGVYTIDTETGETKKIIDLEDYKDWTLGGEEYNSKWFIDHPYWNPDGTKFGFVIKTDKAGGFLFTADADGSNRVFFGPKPLHWRWYDDDTVYGHDESNGNKQHYLKHWDVYGNCIETLGGSGNHGTLSPDKSWVVTDSWHKENGFIRLKLFSTGNVSEEAIIDQQPGKSTGYSHMHPAFSWDGKRVYYNLYVDGGPGSQLYVADLSKVISNK